MKDRFAKLRIYDIVLFVFLDLYCIINTTLLSTLFTGGIQLANLIRVLAIDGGGIRGLIPAQILVELEHLLQAKTHNRNARLADFFDLIAGTSTGGILTCLYLCPNLYGSGSQPRPAFAAEDAVNFYLKLGPQIFRRSLAQRLISLGGLTEAKYSAKYLNRCLTKVFGELRLSQLVKPCLITAYNIEKRYAHFFTKQDAEFDPEYDFLVSDVAQATSAAPNFFPVAGIWSLTKKFYPLIDGGVFANNPALCAFAEVYRSFRNSPSARDMVILSLGTGEDEHPLKFNQSQHWGMIQWAVPLLQILMSANPETVDYELNTIFRSVNRSAYYLRINPHLPDQLTAIDNTTPDNLQALVKIGRQTAEKYLKQLNDLADILITNTHYQESLVEPKGCHFRSTS